MNQQRTLTSPRTFGSRTFGSHTIVPVKEGLWRVVDRSGAVQGHIERRTDASGDRFAARRLVAATRTYELGLFWRVEDAVDCFR